MQLQYLHYGLIVLLLLGVLSLLPASTQAQGDATIAVSPQVAPPGSRFAFYATGLRRGERVGYWFNRPDGSILSNERDYRARAAASGRVDFNWVAPLDAAPGAWEIVVQGMESGQMRTLRFEISLPAVPDASSGEGTVGVEPAVVAPREQVRFFATGFKQRERVAFWAVRPGGSTIRRNRSVRANEAGRADWLWNVPRDAPEGRWQMVAQGTDSGVTRVIEFQVVWR